MRLSALFLLCIGSGLPAQEPTGSIEGTARISARLSAVRPRVRVYDEPGPASGRALPDAHAFSNVVLYLEGVRAGAGPRRTEVPEMRQHGERFLPHVLAVRSGTTVAFPNDDPIYHNVFSLSRARTFDLGRYARGVSKSVTFPAAGVVQVFCHIHADMSGFVLVFDHGFFVTPDADGRFRFEGVPPGEYRLIAWHERIRPLVTPVRVEAGRATTVQLNIPLVDSTGTR